MSIRLFAALSLPDDVAAILGRLQRGIGGARWSPRENLHLTLRFFGEVAEPVADELDGELAQVAMRTAPFELRLKGAGFFGGPQPHALYVGAAANEALATLASRCERAARRIGMAPDARRYTPHVTLAYLSRPELDRVIAFQRAQALFQSAPWRADSFGLYSSVIRDSAPSLYRLEAEYPLSG